MKTPALFFILLAGVFPVSSNAQIVGPQTTFTEQLSIGVLSNAVTGRALGGEFSVDGSGLATTNLYQLDSNGLFTGSNGAAAFTTNINEAFSYNATARSADSVSTVGLSGTVTSGNYSLQSGSMSGEEGGVAVPRDTFSLQNGLNSVMNVGEYMGKTNSVRRSGSLQTAVTRTVNSRGASSTNNQVRFNSEANSSVFSASGSGVTEITAGGFQGGVTPSNNDVDITVLNGGTCGVLSKCAQGDSFSLTHEVRRGDDSSSLTASPSSVNNPGYIQFEYTAGGTTSGSLGIPNTDRSLTALDGGAGTSSSLTKTQQLTVFR